MTGIRVLGSIPLIKQSNIQFGSFDYGQLLVDTYGASEVWSLVDIESGTTIHAKVNSDRDGTLQGWDLQNADGPVSGTLAPYSDGTNDYGDIYTSNGTTGIVDIFDPDKGSMFIWQNVSDWSSPLAYSMNLMADNNNQIYFQKRSGAATMRVRYRAGGTIDQIDVATGSPAGWFSIGISWDTTADEVKIFYNGAQSGSTQTGLGVWAGSLASGTTQIGALNKSGSGIWDGWMAFAAVIFGSIWTPDDFLNMHNDATG